MKKLMLLISCAMIASFASNAQVIESYDLLRTNTWSVYGIGGAATSQGESLFDNVSNDGYVNVTPMFGAGISYNVRPWFRIGFGYDQAKYRRQQRLGVVQADGLSYRNLEVLGNNIDLTLETNISELFERDSKRFNTYVGFGVGGMFAHGVDYQIRYLDSQIDSKLGSSTKFYSELDTRNVSVHLNTVYLPINFSFEYDIVPRVTVALRGSFRALLHRTDLLPTFIENLGVGVKINMFSARRHGYTPKTRQIHTLNSDLESQAETIRLLNEQIAEKNAEIGKIEKTVEQLQEDLEKCLYEKDQMVMPVTEEIIAEYVLYFSNDSFDLDTEALAVINDAVDHLNNNENASVYITTSSSTVGASDHNLALSQWRADSVRDALLDSGISESRITEITANGDEGMDEFGHSRRAIITIK